MGLPTQTRLKEQMLKPVQLGQHKKTISNAFQNSVRQSATPSKTPAAERQQTDFKY